MEARSESTKDVDALLMKLYRRAGMSEPDVKVKVLARNSNNLRTYDLEDMRKAAAFASGQPTSRDVDEILREGGLLPQPKPKRQSAGSGMPEQLATAQSEEARLAEAYKGLGLDETKAQAAARARSES